MATEIDVVTKTRVIEIVSRGPQGPSSGTSPSTSALTVETYWRAESIPPEYQLCLVDNVEQVVTLNGYPETDERVTVDLALGEVTILEHLHDVTVSIHIQAIRRLGGGGTATWGIAFEAWTGTEWEHVESSTKYLTFPKSDADEIKLLAYVMNTQELLANSKYRMVQISDDVSKDIGIISSKPFASMPPSSGMVVSITSR